MMTAAIRVIQVRAAVTWSVRLPGQELTGRR